MNFSGKEQTHRDIFVTKPKTAQQVATGKKSK